MEVLTSLILILELFLSLSLSLMEEPIPILIAKHKQRWHHYSRYKNHRINKKGVIYSKDHSAIEPRKLAKLKEDKSSLKPRVHRSTRYKGLL